MLNLASSHLRLKRSHNRLNRACGQFHHFARSRFDRDRRFRESLFTSENNYVALRNHKIIKLRVFNNKTLQSCTSISMLGINFDAAKCFFSSDSTLHSVEKDRLLNVRNVGILAHVDAGKTTVTERMLALTGRIHRAGSVDDGNTVTDYLPAERERGITIQSAAISFHWDRHNQIGCSNNQKQVKINLIDTPGHVDFSVEVNRSVAVLDSAVLVLDAVAGVQAQTETVWNAISKSSVRNRSPSALKTKSEEEQYKHESLPCIALINKMDKDGSQFMEAVDSISRKLAGANPIPVQLPLYKLDSSTSRSSSNAVEPKSLLPADIVAFPLKNASQSNPYAGRSYFIGCVDLIHMRAIIYPDNLKSSQLANVEESSPQIIPLDVSAPSPSEEQCSLTKIMNEARSELIAHLANYDSVIEEYFLNDQNPSNQELQSAIRRATLNRDIIPALAGAALRGKGVEPVLDAIIDFLPNPLDRKPPALTTLNQAIISKSKTKIHTSGSEVLESSIPSKDTFIRLGHPFHHSLLALAFKVVHMKNRGGSGDGRVVFARVYSGQLQSKDTLMIVSPKRSSNENSSEDNNQIHIEQPKIERIGGMLELNGGRFGNLESGVCKSGEVCALVGLKNVVTGDTLMLKSDVKSSTTKSKKKKIKGSSDLSNIPTDLPEHQLRFESCRNIGNMCLAGVTSPEPVLTMTIETASSQDQTRLSNALKLITVEDPSIKVEETETSTLISGLGELHIDVTIDRLKREFDLEVSTGSPAVAYRETLLNKIETDGLYAYDQLIGDTRLQAAIHLLVQPLKSSNSDFEDNTNNNISLLSEPVITLGPKARKFLQLDEFSPEDELYFSNHLAKSLLSGCRGSLHRGTIGPYEMSNVHCHIVDVDSDGGLTYLNSMPGALRAAAANTITTLLRSPIGKENCKVLEPIMNVEITAPQTMVGGILSDLTIRRGLVGDVIMHDSAGKAEQSKALIQGDVPLAEILGYANSLRSLTGGEGVFTAEYKGHSYVER